MTGAGDHQGEPAQSAVHRAAGGQLLPRPAVRRGLLLVDAVCRGRGVHKDHGLWKTVAQDIIIIVICDEQKQKPVRNNCHKLEILCIIFISN